MSSSVAERSVSPDASRLPETDDGRLYGSQRPRILTVPGTALSSAGQEAVELAEVAGLRLDPWQQFVLDQGLGERADGKWAAFEVCTSVPRQNGKGGIIEARELAGLFLLGERLILHSAHELKTAMEAMRRIEQLLMSSDDLRPQVKTVRRKGGEECIELKSGARLRFIARSKGSGRGMTGDCNIMDEAMILGDEAMEALSFTMAAVPNPQIWYFGSAGIGAPSVQLGRLRQRALAAVETGTPDPSMAYMEWSIDPHVDECSRDCTLHDEIDAPESVLKANPAIGYRLTMEHTAKERLTVGAEGYARERLGVGTYPSTGEDTWRVISEDAWRAVADCQAGIDDGPVALAVDTTPERSHSAISGAGTFGEVRIVDVVDHHPGTGWVSKRIVKLVDKWRPCALVIDAGGPAGSLIPDIRKALKEGDPDEDIGGLTDEEIDELLLIPKTRDVAAAAGQFYDAVAEQRLTHVDQPPMATALAGADKRPVGDGWAWARRGVSVDISPLVASTLALWGHSERAHIEPEGAPNLWL
ncbi:terminase [Streptomyces sp. NPDC051310]|uniref:terminase n=1 Tax=Streptomyces sp. NPDC051310 TaxID=3365649 RepID=UPI00379D491C